MKLAILFVLAACATSPAPVAPAETPPKAVVIVSANMEWKVYDIEEARGDSAEAIADYSISRGSHRRTRAR